jgi:hypothetical protein
MITLKKKQSFEHSAFNPSSPDTVFFPLEVLIIYSDQAEKMHENPRTHLRQT